MLASNKGTHLRFRDEREPLPAALTSLAANLETPSWQFPTGGSSSDDSDADGDDDGGNQSFKAAWEGDHSFEESLSAAPEFSPPEVPHAALVHRDVVSPNAPTRSMLPAGIPTLAIYPAEHNSIAEPSKLISQPWAGLFHFDAFNAVQSLCFNAAACTDGNLVVSGEKWRRLLLLIGSRHCFTMCVVCAFRPFAPQLQPGVARPCSLSWGFSDCCEFLVKWLRR
jgi:hypothetical protein